MARDAKQKRPLFDADSFIAGYGLRIVKGMVRKGLPQLLSRNRTLYLQLCQLFRTGDPQDREVVEAVARTAVEVVDGLIDQLPFVPEKVKDLVDDLGGDVVTEIRDHFAHVTIEIPADLPSLKGGDALKKAADDLKQFLIEIIKKAFERLREQFDFLKRFGVNEQERLISNLLRLGVMDEFMAWYDVQTDETKGRVKRLAKLINEPGEYYPWDDMSDAEKTKFFEQADELMRMEIPEPVRKAFEEFEDGFSTFLGQLNRELETWRRGRQQVLYSDENLARYPHLYNNLPPNDPRRLRHEAERRHSQLRGLRLYGILCVALIIVIGLGIIVSLGDGTKPDVSITYPAAGDTLTSALVTVTGQAVDDHSILNIELQVDRQPRETLVFIPGTHVTWHHKLQLHEGQNSISVWAYDRARQKSAATTSITYRPVKRLNAPTPADSSNQGETND